MIRRLAQVLSVLLSAWFALWACAPAAATRPITGSMDEPNEVGGGVNYSTPLSPSVRCGNELFGCNPGANGQLWYQHRFGERFTLGGTLYGGQTSLFGGGVLARFHLLDSDRVNVGADVNAGWLWADVGVPVAVRVAGPFWVYTEPSVGFRYVQSVRVPLGVAVDIGDHISLSAEGSWGFDPFFNVGSSVGDSTYFGGTAAFAYRF